MTGARRGELCALRWRDVDLDARAITITRSVVKAVEAGSHTLVETDTKTHGSRRIAVDEVTATALEAQRDRMTDRARACEIPILSPDGLVVSGAADGSTPWTPNEVTKAFIRVRERAGLSTSVLTMSGASRSRVSWGPGGSRPDRERLGHANAATALGVYGHFAEERRRRESSWR